MGLPGTAYFSSQDWLDEVARIILSGHPPNRH
jgi:hypothetical protein